jgi:outer membrane immunogenic protein
MRNGIVALLAVVGLGLGLAQSASAADLSAPSYYKAPPLATTSGWTGWYVGVNGGGGWGQTSHSVAFAAPGVAAATTGDFGTSGGLVGGTVGYNFQFGQWLLGGEADLDWSNIQGTFNGTALGGGAGASVSSQLNWLETTRARVGWVWNRAVFYGTAGAAMGGVTANATGAGLTASDTQTRFGWTAGAGIEYAFTNNISAKVEYLYVDLGTQTQITVDSVKFNDNIVRGGLNLRF